jgi:hypothetical protein
LGRTVSATGYRWSVTFQLQRRPSRCEALGGGVSGRPDDRYAATLGVRMRFSNCVRAMVVLMVSLGATITFAPFAYAIEPPQLLSVQASDAEGRVGDIVTVQFKVINRSNQTRTNLFIDVVAPSNAELATYPGHDCTGRTPKQRVTCRANQPYPNGTTAESFTVRIRAANGIDGTVRLRASLTDGTGVSDRYAVKGTSGASPTPSRSATRRPTASVPVAPTVTDEETAVVESSELETDPTTAQASAGEPAGLATGMWIGGGVILVGLGLLASLLVLRRREGDEDDQLPVQ